MTSLFVRKDFHADPALARWANVWRAPQQHPGCKRRTSGACGGACPYAEKARCRAKARRYMGEGRQKSKMLASRPSRDKFQPALHEKGGMGGLDAWARVR